MVGPVSESERRAFQRKLQVVVAALVAVSAALIAVQADAGLVQTAAAAVVGAAVGWVLAWFVFPSGPSPVEQQRQRQRQQAARENPFEEGDESEDGGAGDSGQPQRARREQ